MHTLCPGVLCWGPKKLKKPIRRGGGSRGGSNEAYRQKLLTCQEQPCHLLARRKIFLEACTPSTRLEKQRYCVQTRVPASLCSWVMPGSTTAPSSCPLVLAMGSEAGGNDCSTSLIWQFSYSSPKTRNPRGRSWARAGGRIADFRINLECGEV